MTKLTICVSTFLLALAGCGDDTTGTVDSSTIGLDAGIGGLDAGIGDDTDSGMIDTDAGGDDGAGGDDAGDEGDTGPVSSADLGTCAAPKMVEGEIGSVTIIGNTESGPVGPLDLGTCVNSFEPNAPQDVIVYTVPGDGLTKVEFSLVNDGTSFGFDTMIQLRNTCDETPSLAFPSPCYDDGTDGDFRSSGVTTAMGDDSLIIIVTGYGAENQGAYELSITATPTAKPTLVSATAVSGGVSEFSAEFEGMNTADEILGFSARFLDAADEPVDFNGDGEVDDFDRVAFPFANQADIAAMQSFTGTFVGNPDPLLGDGIAPAIVAIDAAKVRFRIINSAFAFSDPITVEIEIPGAYGDACSTEMPCDDVFVCMGSVCEAGSDLIAFCDGGTDLTLTAPTGPMLSRSALQTGTISAEPGLTEGLAAECVFTGGTAEVFNVTVPDGDFDLIASTEVAETVADTVVYIRSTCADAGSQVACNDDADAVGPSRAVYPEVPAGTYTVFVEQFGTPSEDLPFGVEFLLRPVLASGDACDLDEIDNRCSDGACIPGTSVCP